jgi:RNA polymerase sigma factor for flagellar operon FliA
MSAVAAEIDALPEFERTILWLYYGEEYLMREIAATLALSESRICQILKQTVERLKDRHTERPLHATRPGSRRVTG